MKSSVVSYQNMLHILCYISSKRSVFFRIDIRKKYIKIIEIENFEKLILENVPRNYQPDNEVPRAQKCNLETYRQSSFQAAAYQRGVKKKDYQHSKKLGGMKTIDKVSKYCKPFEKAIKEDEILHLKKKKKEKRGGK